MIQKLACSAALLTTIASTAHAQPTAAANCAAVQKQHLTDVKITEAVAVAATRDSTTPVHVAHCRVAGTIGKEIRFVALLPDAWNGKFFMGGGGGYVGSVDNSAIGSVDEGYASVGTDTGHEGSPIEARWALGHPDRVENFGHIAVHRTAETAKALLKAYYGKDPERSYFLGCSNGGRQALMEAQRYPADFDGIFSRVPVIQWTGLQHAGLRDGLALTNGGWMDAAQVKLVADAVLAACDGADGAADGIVADPVGCRARFDVTRLRCSGAPSDQCLTEAQVRAVQTLHAPLDLGMELANGLRSYPGRGPSGENTPASGPTGGWRAWWTGSAPPAFPPVPANGIAWFYGAGAIQYFYARDPKADLRSYRIQDHAQRVREVSALMDSTDPDLSAFAAHGGKLILLENLGDYAQSPYAGIGYHDAVVQRLGRETVDRFFKLFTAPGVDHVGTGAPANADLFAALVAWVEDGRPPARLQLVEQDAKPPFAVRRSRPLCEWPQVPRYRGGDVNTAGSFACRQMTQ